MFPLYMTLLLSQTLQLMQHAAPWAMGSLLVVEILLNKLYQTVIKV